MGLVEGAQGRVAAVIGTVALAALSALMSGTTALLGWQWKRSESERQKEKARADALGLELADWKGRYAAAVADARRLELVISGLKTEIADLEQDVSACREPGAVRQRLQRLLAGRP